MKTKKSIQLLLIALLVFMPAVASAYTGTIVIDGIRYYANSDDKTAEVRAKSPRYTGDIVIPETVEYEGVTCRVTGIGNYAFYRCSSLTSVVIPNSVTSIGTFAFFACTGLTSVTIPNSVTSIGAKAFWGCSSLTSITIPNSVTSIGEETFLGCSSLTSVTIPNSVTSIGAEAFWGCSCLTSVTIGNSVNRIWDEAFYNCSSLTSVIIGTSVDYIGRLAFYGCTSLTSVHITDIAAWCRISFEDNPLSYARHLYLNGGEVKNLIIPNSVTSIGNRAFSGCSYLTSVIIGNSVTSIGENAFSGCSELIKVSIGSGIKNIGATAFANCPKIEDVYCYAVRYPTTESSAFSQSYPDYITLHVPENSVTQYKKVSPWNTFYDVVPLDYYATDIPGAPKCAKPTISYSKGQLVMNCATEGVEYITNITDTDIKQHYSPIITLSVTYEISVYATKQGYNNSDVVTATLCWIEGDPRKEGFTENDPTDTKQLKALPVLIQAEGGEVSIDGAPEGTKIAVYDAGGVELGAAISRGGKTLVPAHLPQGSIAIVKIGEKVVKIVVK